jgi:hypothetical protein
MKENAELKKKMREIEKSGPDISTIPSKKASMRDDSTAEEDDENLREVENFSLC